MEKDFWENRWQTNEIGWDMGAVSPPLKTYFDQLRDRSVKILIPGCGNAYEAQYLWEIGFENVFVMDVSRTALNSFSERFKTFPKDQMLCEDFFEHRGQYDLIIEQTFFCAIDPKRRSDYVEKMAELLKNEGKLVGLLFQFPLDDGPPFGGLKEEYLPLFERHFDIRTMEDCHNSIKPRAGRELFIQLTPKRK